MSKQGDNTENRKLKDFLDKNKTSVDKPIDDFEKEALEGFSMLDSEEEALNLKSSLDAKIYKEVFSEEKKSNTIIWYAAAGLLLLIGFSVYFIQNTSISKNEGLAVHSETPKMDEIQKKLEDTNKKNENIELKEAGKLLENRVTEPKKSEGEKKSLKHLTPDQVEKTISIQNSNVGNASEEVIASEVQPQAASPMATMEDQKVMMQPSPSSGAISLGSTKDITQDHFDKASYSVNKEDERIYLKEVKKAKTSNSKKRAKEDERTVASDANSTSQEVSGSSCSYPGGEEALIKALKNSLSSKNLSRKFDATLFINQKGKVEKVVFTNAFDFNKTEQKDIVEFLKQLNKFDVKGFTGKTLAEYKLAYRP